MNKVRGQAVFTQLAYAALGVVLAVLVLELVLRAMPLKRIPLISEINAEHPLNRRTPSTEYSFSYGWRLENAHRTRTNASGFVSGQEYDQPRPDLSIVGNSYIEASELLPGQHMAERLSKHLQGARAYSFGTAGAALSDYIAMGGWAQRNYRPQWQALLVTEQDLGKSLKCAEGRTCLIADSSGALQLRTTPWKEGRLYALIFKSDFLNYITRNLRFRPSRLLNNEAENESAKPGSSVDRSADVIEAFLRLWPITSGTAPERTLLIIDADRAPAVANQPIADVPALTEFTTRTRAAGYRIIEMKPRFEAYRQHSRARLDFRPSDSHWSAVSHDLAAAAIADELRSAGWPAGRE